MILPLLSALIFLIGTFFAVFTDVSFTPYLASFIALLFFRSPRIAWLMMLLLFSIWSVDTFESQENVNAPLEEWVSLSGEIVEEVDIRVDHKKIIVDTEYGRVLVKLSLYQEVAFGDTVEISGQLQKPSEDIEGFNYANFLARYRVWLVIYDGWADVLEPADFSVRGFLYSLKSKIEVRLNSLYFEPEASFVAGLLLGSRKGMPENVALAFQHVGLTHIVAISGYNISLVIALVFLLFSFLPLKKRVVVSSVAILLFVILVGASAAVVRAGIMGSLTLWGLYAGRRSQVFFALLWSAVFMVLMNPYILVFDVGFQLSFASTLGLLIFVPILEEKIRFWKNWPVLREALLLTLAAQISTIPFMAFHFGRVSWISPVANVLVAPFLPMAMLFGALSIVCGKPMALLAMVYLKIIIGIALLLDKIPFIEIPLPFSVLSFGLSLFFLLNVSLRFYKSILVRAFGLCRVGVFSKFLGLQSQKREK